MKTSRQTHQCCIRVMHTTNSFIMEGNETRSKLDILIGNCDDFFLIIMGIFVLFMQAGFGFLEAGSIRAKNTTNILIKNYADLCIGKLENPERLLFVGNLF